MKFKNGLANWNSKYFDKNLLLILVPLFIWCTSWGQNNQLSVFEPLMNKTWKAEGKWSDGSKFVQESKFSYSLDSTLIVVNSKGFVDNEQLKFGLRNHGIRKFDETSKSLQFWEFDVFGGLTKGKVIAEGKNLWYSYTYGESQVFDYWEYVDEHTYNFTVGSFENGQWKQIYLQTQFVSSSNDFSFTYDHYSLIVKELDKTADFYSRVLGLEEIPHPDRAPGFRWFRINNNQELHLIEKKKVTIEKNKSMHLCMATQKLKAFRSHLEELNIPYFDWPGEKGKTTLRTDGVEQLYIQDPEGYWIEINDAKHQH